jgi:hypothetical protein
MAKLSEVSKTDLPNRMLEDEHDFSLVLGGPLYQLYLRTRLTIDPLDLLVRRVIGVTAICWLPLLLLALFDHDAVSGPKVPFLFDLGVHTRLLAALPLLIVAEVIVHQRIRRIVKQFLDREIIASEDRPRFQSIIDSTMRLRNSVAVEVALLVIVYSAGHWLWKENLTNGVTTWFAHRVGEETQYRPAGYWYALVSLPFLRFILLRWYYRLFLWYRFLWKVRGLPLRLNLFHPDRAGGLGFLAGSALAFAPVLVAHTILLAGVIGNRIFYLGATLTSFKLDIVGAVFLLILLVLAPLFFFMNHLNRAQRTAGREYGILASHYVDDFREKWIKGDNPEDEPLLGTGDIQSLADLGNAYSVVAEMRIVPFGRSTVLRLAILLILPLLPLTLTVIPLEEMIDRLIKLAL